QGIEEVARDIVPEGPAPQGEPSALAAPQHAARRAQGAMGNAAEAAEQGQAPGAEQAGQEAERELEGLPEQLRARRDSLSGAWKRETLAALDRALSETAALAERQQRVAEALRGGETTAEPRSAQASVEEGTAAVERQIREAAGKHALVSPQLESALGFARRQMAAARRQLEEANPNASEAAGLAEEAVDALNATALALARSRSQVAGAQSGSGFAEAVEQLARMARDQEGLNGQARGLLPMMGPSGRAVLEQLRAIAARQRALAQQLERLQAEGGRGSRQSSGGSYWSTSAGARRRNSRSPGYRLSSGRRSAATPGRGRE